MKKTTIILLSLAAVAAIVGIILYLRKRNAAAAPAVGGAAAELLPVPVSSGWRTLLDMASGNPPPVASPIKYNRGNMELMQLPPISATPPQPPVIPATSTPAAGQNMSAG